MTKAASASSAANVVIMSPNFSRKSNVDSMKNR
jgi:hypothetical protein